MLCCLPFESVDTTCCSPRAFVRLYGMCVVPLSDIPLLRYPVCVSLFVCDVTAGSTLPRGVCWRALAPAEKCASTTPERPFLCARCVFIGVILIRCILPRFFQGHGTASQQHAVHMYVDSSLSPALFCCLPHANGEDALGRFVVFLNRW